MSLFSFSRSRMASASLVAIAVAGLGAYGALRAGTPPPSSQATLPEVDVAVVLQQTITELHTYSGRLAAVEQVEIRPQVSGAIVAVNIRDGALVHKGDLLFVIDPRPYQAEVDRATGLLAAAQARADYLQADGERAQRLIGDNAIARRDYDEKRHAAREAAANLQSARAALAAAKINLDHTRIAAPIAGRVSRAEMTLGNVVGTGAGAAPLTTIVSVSPMYAEFDADEQSYLQYSSRSRHGGKVAAELGLAGENGYPRQGEMQSVDNRLNPSSGTIRMRARFDNRDGVLVPGLYARIRMGGGAPHAALLVDDAVIGTDQSRKFVYVIDQQDRAIYREVQVGALRGNLRVINSGLQAGERVVVNGAQRIQAETRVRAHLVAMGGTPGAGQLAESTIR
ncbi:MULTISPECIES: efflux RND transporter periplasmic adaptor subunit [unclassified Janthinobacterium]|uniref:efflux RND transporter periplasmic adaptor subunit n=1 Tax=unclassified Janthinobacterium TaxID=2610881 RepID=UPI00160A7104|nr:MULTISPECIES: efflux RND transporter periplasmic adaptor subunit [unclassified Janthinobacterium]MBB5371357.1 multidrug efflux system membrane fusion protein [Janthinobacterium sp. K2C7]MBB5384163.1 multidrug efflux system membrane fusion protein [Janthinobacterium sp. K2Li3]MBB5389377.1 multidrug efflux system membrane fusion protein [Janthinobacterium sp. K2E3]